VGELVKPQDCKSCSFGIVSSSLTPFKTACLLMFLHNYFSIFVFFAASLLLSSIIFLLSFLLSAKADDTEKLSAYECGFSPFEDSRGEFDIRFYLVAILFIIFDLEISFLFPFAISFDTVGAVGLYSMFFFLFVLTIGFVYE
jgi:NADH-quinone oxidoreductase subunit A